VQWWFSTQYGETTTTRVEPQSVKPGYEFLLASVKTNTERERTMRAGYGVIVTHLGEPILTIEPAMLSGKAELSADDTAAIRDAGEHLLAFAGPEHVTCFGCGSENGEHFDCPVFQPGAKTKT
jgi:hypothetical protein